MTSIMYYSYCETCEFEHHEQREHWKQPLATYHKEKYPTHRVLIIVQAEQ